MGNGGSGHQFAIGDLNNTSSYTLMYSCDIWIQNTKSRLAKLLNPKKTWKLPKHFVLNTVLYHTFLSSVYTQRVSKHTPCYLTYRKYLYFWIKRLSCPNISQNGRTQYVTVLWFQHVVSGLHKQSWNLGTLNTWCW